MQRNASGFYHDPPLWVEGSPIDYGSDGMPNFESFRDEIFRQKLANGIEIKVTREGLFLFGFADWAPGVFPDEHNGLPADFNSQAEVILHRTNVMNAFLAFLYTNEQIIDNFSSETMVVTPELIISLHDLDHTDMGFGNSRVSRLALSSYPSTYQSSLPYVFDDRVSMRGRTISIAVIKRTVDDLESLITNLSVDGILLVDLFIRASKSYHDHNYSSALITYWAITEKLLQELWKRYQDDNRLRRDAVFISDERRKRLNDGRTFTAAVISEALSFADYIDYDLYYKMSNVRKIRNDWMHSQKVVSSNNAQTATDVCERLLLLVHGIKLYGQKGLTLHG